MCSAADRGDETIPALKRGVVPADQDISSLLSRIPPGVGRSTMPRNGFNGFAKLIESNPPIPYVCPIRILAEHVHCNPDQKYLTTGSSTRSVEVAWGSCIGLKTPS